MAASGARPIGRAASIHLYPGGVSRFRIECQVSVMTRTSNRSSTTVRESVEPEHAFTQPTSKQRSSGTPVQRRRPDERRTGVVNDAVDEKVATAEGHKKLSYHRGTARCVVSVEVLPIATQQCINYTCMTSPEPRSKYQRSLIDPCDKIVL